MKTYGSYLITKLDEAGKKFTILCFSLLGGRFGVR